MPLYTVIVEHGADRWRVRSGLATRPVAGDRIRYADLLELDVAQVTLNVGAGGDVEVLAFLSPPFIGRGGLPRAELEERLERLRFRREALTPG